MSAHDDDDPPVRHDWRDEPRLTEDEIAKRKLGEQGIPGKPPKPPVTDERDLQISEDIDPGHTA